MKRASLCRMAASLMLLSLCVGILVAQTSDSVFVNFSPITAIRPLASVGGILHADDCDSVRIVGLTFTWHTHFPPYQVQPLDWSAGRGQDVSQSFPLPPTAPGFPEDAHVVYVVYPPGPPPGSLDIDPLVPGHPYELAPGCDGLSIQLSSFIGTVINNRVRLDWTTVSEVGNYGFFVQKKRTGETAWSEIPNSFVAGHGTTNIPHQYTFTDNAIVTSAVQYRLKQMDLDGTIHHTEPIQIESPTGVKEIAPLAFALQQNYPNPFNPETHIKFSVAAFVHTRLEVYNLVGQKVAVLFDDIAEPGYYYNVRFEGSNLSGGVYFYRLQAGNFVETKKLILLR